jgi:hypothetical protein
MTKQKPKAPDRRVDSYRRGPPNFGFMNTPSTRLVIFPFLLALCAIGCTANRPFRTDFPPCDSTQGSANGVNPVIEVTTNYKLGFVEFDDQGWFWNTRQLETVEQMIRCEAGIGQSNVAQPIVMVVFTHGWKNNAATNNDNVEMFRKTLDQLGVSEGVQTNHDRRKIVGIYAGWRGLSATVEPFKELSFWERKNTAHKVGGYGAMSELLVKLDALQQASNDLLATNSSRTELIIVGHSFGGGAVYSAISEIFAERFVETVQQGALFKPLGDQVILLNPAFEASRHYNLNQMALSNAQYPTNQRPALSIFTSEGDWATHYFFPIGRFFSTLFEKNRNSKQRRANLDAVGWYEPFVTYDLIYSTNAPAGANTTFKFETKTNQFHGTNQLRASIKNVLRQRKNWELGDPAATYQFDDAILKPRLEPGTSAPKRGTRDPFPVVSVDKKIMKDHDDINNPVLINFLREYILFCHPDSQEHWGFSRGRN